MFIVAIHDWQQGDVSVIRKVADAMGCLVFEVQQRMAGEGPVVVAQYADGDIAESLQEKLMQADVPAILLDLDEVRSGPSPLIPRRFSFSSQHVRFDMDGGTPFELAFTEIRHILVATTVTTPAEKGEKTTERKFSLGKTVLAGGVPMTKKVVRQSAGVAEEREEVVCLVNRNAPSVFLPKNGLDYSGRGEARQMTRDLNFNYLKKELRSRAGQAIYDDRLLQRAAQVRLLGTRLDPDTHLDLAFKILELSL